MSISNQCPYLAFMPTSNQSFGNLILITKYYMLEQMNYNKIPSQISRSVIDFAVLNYDWQRRKLKSCHSLSSEMTIWITNLMKQINVISLSLTTHLQLRLKDIFHFFFFHFSLSKPDTIEFAKTLWVFIEAGLINADNSSNISLGNKKGSVPVGVSNSVSEQNIYLKVSQWDSYLRSDHKPAAEDRVFEKIHRV